MKIFRNVFMVAAALALGLVSCNNDDNGGVPTPHDGVGTEPGATIGITISIPGTRAIGEAQWEHPVHLEEGIVLLSTGEPNSQIRAARVLTVTGTAATTQFENVSGGITQVAFVANTNILDALGVTDVDALVGRPLDDVRNIALDVTSQVQRDEDMNPGAGNNVNVFREAALVNAGTNPANPTNNLWTATLLLEPTVARVEIFNITGSSAIKGFNVLGIFIDAYYKTGLVGSGRTGWTAHGDGTEASITGFAAHTTQFPEDLRRAIWDAPVAVGDWEVKPVSDAASPSYGNLRATPPVSGNLDYAVWGYNLFAGNITPGAVLGTRTPRIAIKLEDVLIEDVFTYRLEFQTWTWVNTMINEVTRLAVPGDDGLEIAPGVYFVYDDQDPEQTITIQTWQYVAQGIVDHHVTGEATAILPHYRTRRFEAGTNPMTDAEINDVVRKFIADYLTAAGTPTEYTDVDGALIAETINDATDSAAFALEIAEAVAEAVATHEAGRAEFTDNTSLFISIRGFQGIDRTTGFMPRHVYQMGSYTSPHGPAPTEREGWWEFGPGDLNEIPFIRNIDVDVTVEVQNWIPTPITPELQ